MSDETYLRFWESYARGPPDEINSLPKEIGDFRERVPRETIRGRWGLFHRSVEEHLYRQWRAYTCPRAFFWLAVSYSFMQHGLLAFLRTFPNVTSYGRFSHHPNYKLLGPAYSWFFLLRPIFFTYITIRLFRWNIDMFKRYLHGKGEPHYFWYYDNLYPDFVSDPEDMRYINFRYTDQRVSPDVMTGYYPYDQLKYGKFLNQKEASKSGEGLGY